MSGSPARVGDLVEFAAVPAVLALGDAARLREDLDARAQRLPRALRSALEGLLGGYLIEQPENRAACDALLGALAGATGRAFFLRGVYGAGKTHLLSVVALLAGHPAAWPFFLASHPQYERVSLAVGRSRRLVVPISLDEFRGPSRPLEEIVFQQIERELAGPRYGVQVTLSDAAQAIRLLEEFAFPEHQGAFETYLRRAAGGAPWADLQESDPQRAGALARRFAERIGLPAAPTRSRADAMAEALAGAKQAGLDGVVLLLDELGLFLSAKTRRELNEDAAFLQFIAQRARRARVWLIAAIQRQVEDIGSIDAYSLRQIKDRFFTCTLDIAQLRTVLSRRVVVRKDPETFARTVGEVWRRLGGDGLGFGRDDLTVAYPVNPLALDLLEALADSVLSKTRSLLQFLQSAAASDGLLGLPAERLLTPDAMFRCFRDQMEGLPELRRHLGAHRFFAEHLRRIGAANRDLAAALVDTLTLLAVAGARWPLRDLADALIGSAAWAQAGPESPEAFRRMVARELDALRRRGAYLEIVRSVEPGGDQYFLDVTTDASEVIRRRLNRIVDAFEPRDGRVLAAAAGACGQPAFPLASLAEPRAVGFEWMADRRTAAVSRRDLATLTAEHLSHLAAVLSAPHCREDVHLLIGEVGDAERQEAAWRSAAAGLAGRDAAGVVAWIPREPTQAEWQELAEHAALRMLADDPTVSGRRGADLRRRVRERLEASAAMAAGVVARLHYEGRALDAGGRPATDPAALKAAQGDWPATLAALLAGALQRLFPRQAALAPKRVLGRVHVNQIVDHFVRPGRISLPPGAGLEAHLNDFLAPLGFVDGRDGTYALRVRATPLVDWIESQVPEPRDEPLDAGQLRRYGDLVGVLAKSEFGLTPEQSELAIACLVRAGHLVALDAFCQPLPFDRIGTPMGEHVPFLTRARLLEAETADALSEVVQAILGRRPRRLDLAGQQRLWEGALAWKRRTLEEAPRVQAALEGLIAAFGQEPVQWSETCRALEAAGESARALDDGVTARDGLTALAAQGDSHLLKTFGQARDFLLEEAEAVAGAYRYVTDPRFEVMAESLLVSQRQRFLRWVGRAEAMISQRARVRRAAEDTLRAYGNEYVAWHERVHAARRFAGYPALRQGDAYRALQTVSATGVDGGEALRRAEAAIREQMGKHCPGTDLSQALASSPVCALCGLRLGDSIELAPPSRIERRIRAWVQRLIGLLHEPEVEQAIERRLGAEQDAKTAGAVGRAMKLPPTAEPGAVLRVFTREAAEWIAECLRRRPVGRRRLDDLIALLANKQLTKREVAEAFARWLDAAGGVGDDDVIEIR